MALAKPLHSIIRALIFCSLFQLSSSQTIPEYRLQFENLPQEERDAFYEHIVEAKRLFSQQRIFEALEEITTAEGIIPNFPALLSIKGACYIEFRDFEKAEAVFQKSLEISPNNYGLFFNIGEIHFVQAQWEEAKTYFEKVTNALSATPENSTHLLAKFKVYICDKKLENNSPVEEVEALYDFTTDSPIFYYVNAVKEFENGNNTEAQLELMKARRVFKKQGELDAWHDSLVESGYIKSFYGGGDRAETTDGLQLKGAGTDKVNLDTAPIKGNLRIGQ